MIVRDGSFENIVKGEGRFVVWIIIIIINKF